MNFDIKGHHGTTFCKSGNCWHSQITVSLTKCKLSCKQTLPCRKLVSESNRSLKVKQEHSLTCAEPCLGPYSVVEGFGDYTGVMS